MSVRVCVRGVHPGITAEASTSAAGYASDTATKTAREAAAQGTAELCRRGSRDEGSAGQQNWQQCMACFEVHVMLRLLDALFAQKMSPHAPPGACGPAPPAQRWELQIRPFKS